MNNHATRVGQIAIDGSWWNASCARAEPPAFSTAAITDGCCRTDRAPWRRRRDLQPCLAVQHPPYPLVGLSMAPDFEETLASAPATGLRPVLEKVPDESPSLAGWLARGRYTGWPPCLARGCGQGSDAGGTAGR